MESAHGGRLLRSLQVFIESNGQASRHESISDRHSLSFGAGRPSGRFLAGGSGDSNAWRTVRLCTPCFRANA